MELKVLFVDDEINILNALQREIQDCGFNSFFASSAKEALDMLQSNDISLVVTDLHMPSVNGIELLKQIRNDYPEIIRIVLTGYADKDMVIDAINQGQVFYYIMKPCDLDELKIIVNKGLEYFRTQKERKELYSILFEEKSKIENLNQSLNKSLIEQANTIVYQKNKIEDAYNKLNELSILKRDVINLVSHELRTPLTIMMSAIELLEFVEPNEQKQVIANLKTGLNRLNRIVSDILTISLLKSPKKIYNFNEIEIISLSKSAFDEMRNLAKQKKITLHFNNNIEKPQLVSADKDKIFQALENIIDNAIRSIKDKGEIYLNLSLQNIDDKKFIKISHCCPKKIYKSQGNSNCSKFFNGVISFLSIESKSIKLSCINKDSFIIRFKSSNEWLYFV